MEPISTVLETKEIPEFQNSDSPSPSQSFKGQLGGARPGAGRPPGRKSTRTIEREIIRKEFEDRILENIHELLASQFSLARGASFVYRIEVNPKTGHKEHILVDDPIQIKEFLDEYQGGNGEMDGEFYYITTRAPENRALDSLLDRVFGKAPQEMKHTGTIAHQIVGMRVVQDQQVITPIEDGNRIQE